MAQAGSQRLQHDGHSIDLGSRPEETLAAQPIPNPYHLLKAGASMVHADF